MIKLYLNENVPKAVSYGLWLRGYDVVTTYAAGNSGATDSGQLDFAVQENRVLFTFNVRDFVKLHCEYISTGGKHQGIILAKQMPVGIIIRTLSKLMMLKTADIVEKKRGRRMNR